VGGWERPAGWGVEETGSRELLRFWVGVQQVGVPSVALALACFVNTFFCFCRRYVGTHGVYTLTTPYERDEQCPICSPGVLLEVDPSASLQQVGWPPRTGGQLGLGKAGSRGLAAFSSVWVGGDRVVASILGLAWARV
jgi:hypothetical protein